MPPLLQIEKQIRATGNDARRPGRFAQGGERISQASRGEIGSPEGHRSRRG
jgi:hypothetical protein